MVTWREGLSIIQARDNAYGRSTSKYQYRECRSRVMKVWVVVDEYNDGGAAGDFLKEIFQNEDDAKQYKDEEWYRYDYKIKEWEIK